MDPLILLHQKPCRAHAAAQRVLCEYFMCMVKHKSFGYSQICFEPCDMYFVGENISNNCNHSCENLSFHSNPWQLQTREIAEESVGIPGLISLLTILFCVCPICVIWAGLNKRYYIIWASKVPSITIFTSLSFSIGMNYFPQLLWNIFTPRNT